MKLALLVDIGSTYTKASAVDLESLEVIGHAQAPTSVETNVTIGLNNAINELSQMTGVHGIEKFERRLACSSAAGGLRMVAIGLAYEKTVEAARRAVLGAGAKVVGIYACELTAKEMQQIEESRPDIILFSGGTDGGNDRVLRSNAERIAASDAKAPIVVAGNNSAAESVGRILGSSGKTAFITENLMPKNDVLNIEPARRVIRELFISRIIRAKGIQKAESIMERIVTPTPAAVLTIARILSLGVNGESGLGEIMVLDVGGATTDVYSMSKGLPSKRTVILEGLAEPFDKRTVEGDLGIRYNAPTILQLAGHKLAREVAQYGLSQWDVSARVKILSRDVGMLPIDQSGTALDTALARNAVDIAVERHTGRQDTVFAESMALEGKVTQTGKDLSRVAMLVGTGGVVNHHKTPKTILEAAVYSDSNPASLRPKAPKYMIDPLYVLPAMGLLAESEPLKALRIMKNSLKNL